MRKILTVAALMGGMFVASAALADNNINSNVTDTPGTTSTQVGTSMNEPMVDSQVVATLPRGSQVTVIGTTNGWAHVRGDGFDGYTDYVQLADVPSPPNTTYYTVYPSTSPTYYQPAPTYYQTTPTYRYQSSPTYYQTTPTYQYQSPPTYYQSTPTYQYQSSPTYYQTTPTYQSTPTYYQSTPTYYQTTPTYQYQSTTTYYNPTTRVVNGYGGTIHQAPYSDSSLVTTLPPGTQVTVVGSVNGRWSHVVANGYDGYIDNGELQ